VGEETSAGRDSPKRQRVEEGEAQAAEVLCVKKLTDLATVPTRGSQFAAGSTRVDGKIPLLCGAILNFVIVDAVRARRLRPQQRL
jgi:hypothetical protein